MMLSLIWTGCSSSPSTSTANTKPLKIISQETHQEIIFQVELATTHEQQMRGLMFRQNMALDHGMFFIFDQDQTGSFWMKNTYIPLDIFYIDAKGQILSIVQNATPLSEESLRAEKPYRYVLELNGGVAKKYSFKPQDKVELQW